MFGVACPTAPAWSDLGRLVPLPRASACFLVCEPSGCRARSVLSRRVISYIGATVDWARFTACPHCVFSLRLRTACSHCVLSPRVTDTACSHCVLSLRLRTACSHCVFSPRVCGVTRSYSMFGVVRVYSVGVVRSYSMFGVVRAYSAVRRWSCLCGLYVWSCTGVL